MTPEQESLNRLIETFREALEALRDELRSNREATKALAGEVRSGLRGVSRLLLALGVVAVVVTAGLGYFLGRKFEDGVQTLGTKIDAINLSGMVPSMFSMEAESALNRLQHAVVTSKQSLALVAFIPQRDDSKPPNRADEVTLLDIAMGVRIEDKNGKPLRREQLPVAAQRVLDVQTKQLELLALDAAAQLERVEHVLGRSESVTIRKRLESIQNRLKELGPEAGGYAGKLKPLSVNP